ncbi:hypothetical protein AAY473_004360 [Plecturocebus cupreus]
MDGQTDTAASPSQTHASPDLLGTAVNVPPTPIPSPSRRCGGHLASSAATPSSSLPRSESDTKETGAWAQAESDQQAPQSSRQKAQDEARRAGPCKLVYRCFPPSVTIKSTMCYEPCLAFVCGRGALDETGPGSCGQCRLCIVGEPDWLLRRLG